ncbi:MAG TPA: SAM-dependent chlorinase/fluorinase [Desulfobacterales bacterium]|nr:SAM-dependent chlorinase/fluorinase [Desulfobacterales bacterium]
MAIISLTTDFGTQDEYVGVMKAVILGIDPSAAVVDVSHAIDPQDVAQAAFLVRAAHAYFPPGSIHLVVVDPGVGTARDILLLDRGGHRFVAPDNGVLSLMMDGGEPFRLRRLENPAWRLAAVSPTFHGRDIMAPAAARLCRGADPAEFGPEVDPRAVVRLQDVRPRRTPGGIDGRVVQFDRFGNLVTNIDRETFDAVVASGVPEIRVGDAVTRGIHQTYADGAPGTLLALFGSRGTLEVAVVGGDARRMLGADKSATVRVRCP